MVSVSLIAGVGLLCATTFAVGFGFFVPVSSAVGGLFYFLAVGSAVLFVGILEGQ
jgi:hypothetical protein